MEAPVPGRRMRALATGYLDWVLGLGTWTGYLDWDLVLSTLHSLLNYPLRAITLPSRIRRDLEKKRHEFRKSFQISNTFPDSTPSGARSGQLCGAQISDVDWQKRRITLAEHKTARK